MVRSSPLTFPSLSFSSPFFRYFLYVFVYVSIIILLYAPVVVSSIESNKIYSDEGWIKMYSCREYNCSNILSERIYSSNESSCVFYDLGEKGVLNSLIEKNVSTLLFDKNYEKLTSKKGIYFPDNFISVESKGLMHNKFCVFDDDSGLTGTWNPTDRGTYKNDNAVVLFSSEKLNTFYENDYKHILNRNVLSPSPLHVNLSGSMIDAYLCPQHHCEERVINEIDLAKGSIDVLAFSFTSKPLAQKLVEARKRGVDVRVIFEKTRIASYSQYDYLSSENISVFKDGNSYTMHEKLFVIDNSTVIIGSYNPTKNADEKNDENILVVKNNFDFSTYARREFKRVFEIVG